MALVFAPSSASPSSSSPSSPLPSSSPSSPAPLHSAPGASPHSFSGFVHSEAEAQAIFQAVREGKCKVVSRLSHAEQECIQPGCGFVYYPSKSNIKRWTDGRKWGDAFHPGGNTRIYKELLHSQGSKAAAKSSSTSNAAQKPDKPNGLFKKTVCDTHSSREDQLKIVVYYHEANVASYGPLTLFPEHPERNGVFIRNPSTSPLAPNHPDFWLSIPLADLDTVKKTVAQLLPAIPLEAANHHYHLNSRQSGKSKLNSAASSRRSSVASVRKSAESSPAPPSFVDPCASTPGPFWSFQGLNIPSFVDPKASAASAQQCQQLQQLQHHQQTSPNRRISFQALQLLNSQTLPSPSALLSFPPGVRNGRLSLDGSSPFLPQYFCNASTGAVADGSAPVAPPLHEPYSVFSFNFPQDHQYQLPQNSHSLPVSPLPSPFFTSFPLHAQGNDPTSGGPSRRPSLSAPHMGQLVSSAMPRPFAAPHDAEGSVVVQASSSFQARVSEMSNVTVPPYKHLRPEASPPSSSANTATTHLPASSHTQHCNVPQQQDEHALEDMATTTADSTPTLASLTCASAEPTVLNLFSGASNDDSGDDTEDDEQQHPTNYPTSTHSMGHFGNPLSLLLAAAAVNMQHEVRPAKRRYSEEETEVARKLGKLNVPPSISVSGADTEETADASHANAAVDVAVTTPTAPVSPFSLAAAAAAAMKAPHQSVDFTPPQTPPSHNFPLSKAVLDPRGSTL